MVDFRRKWKETVRSVVNDSKIVNDDKCLDMNSEAKLDYQLLYGRCAREWVTLPDDDAAQSCLPLHLLSGARDCLRASQVQDPLILGLLQRSLSPSKLGLPAMERAFVEAATSLCEPQAEAHPGTSDNKANSLYNTH